MPNPAVSSRSKRDLDCWKAFCGTVRSLAYTLKRCTPVEVLPVLNTYANSFVVYSCITFVSIHQKSRMLFAWLEYSYYNLSLPYVWPSSSRPFMRQLGPYCKMIVSCMPESLGWNPVGKVLVTLIWISILPFGQVIENDTLLHHLKKDC